jgi:hypothetical protein
MEKNLEEIVWEVMKKYKDPSCLGLVHIKRGVSMADVNY